MGLLDGDLQAVFGAAFANIYLDGTLHRVSKTPNGKGGWSSASADAPIKGQIDACTEAMRVQAGYTENDVRLIILQAGVSPALNGDDEVTLGGRRWSVRSPMSDPANTQWVARGTPAT